MPALAPHSMDMLAIVMRPSMERLRIASPRYSTMWPRPPPVPTCAISASTRSLAVTPGASAPVTLTAMVFGRACGSVCVASTCSTSLVPMPNASAPNAPCVAVCESPHTIVRPGWVTPSCGPMTCTMPWLSSPSGCSRMPNSAQLRRSVSICVREVGSAIVSGSPRRRLNAGSAYPVGVLWSSVASVRSVRRTARPAARRPSNACGLVTSCSRCRSMKSRSGSPSADRTTWASQTFSARVLGGRLGCGVTPTIWTS